jgi:hypothetical protein
MGRRLFERLEQGVERIAAEHVNFVDDVDLVARRNGSIAHRLDDLAHVVDAGVAGRVHLDHVDMAPFGNRTARLALAARVDRRAALPIGADAVERLGDQARGAGLAHPRTPVIRKAWARRSRRMALARVWTMASCPISAEKVCGRYLRGTR